MNRHTTPLERAAAIFLTRTMVGFVYLFEGLHSLTGVSGGELDTHLVALADFSRFLPPPIVMVAGVLVPFVDVVLGALVLIGFWARPALRALAMLIVLIAVAYGISGLLHPMGPTAMDITVVNFYILPRAVLLVVTLFLPADDDLLSVDALRDRNARGLFVRPL